MVATITRVSAGHERALRVGAEFVRQPGMIGAGGDAVFREKRGDLLGGFLARDIDDRRAIDGGQPL